MEQDVPLLRSIAGWMLLKARIILSFHSPLNPACREMRTVPSVAAGRNYCRGLSGHTVAAYGNVDALMLCSLAHSIITVFGSSRGKKQCVSNLFSIPILGHLPPLCSTGEAQCLLTQLLYWQCPAFCLKPRK